jgi:thioredoxin-dependent peroxiredoxin
LADYSEHLEDLRAAGAQLVAISVDDAARAETVRQELGVKFPLLCDTSREVVKKYGLLSSGEKGGISFPASFVIDRDRVVRFRALEQVASRVSVDQLLELVRELGRGADPKTKPRHRGVFPGLMFIRATMNTMRHGVRSPNK